MPTYEYECVRGHRFEKFQSIKDEPLKRCPKCGRRARRVPSAGAGLLFRGSGFHVTDYRSSSYREKARQESGGVEPGGKGKSKSPPRGAKPGQA
jgi:putative FmdB family regulatory protein